MILDELSQSFTQISLQTQANLALLFKIILIPWIVYFLNLLLNHRLFYLGIFPRRIYGLPGIIFAPLLHGNFNHLFFNSIPLFVLADFILMYGFHFFLSITVFITLLSGTLIWLLGKPGLHIGASALITGYWGFLVSGLYFELNLVSIILGILSLYYFAAILLGLLPKKGVSWEGHLFGLIAGVLARFFLI